MGTIALTDPRNLPSDPPARVHPRTIGWVGTTALAMGGSNQSLFLLAALFAGQGDIPGQGSASIILLAVGLALSIAAAPGWIELVLMSPNRVGGIAAACTTAFKPYSGILSALAGVCYWWGWVPTCGLTALFSATAINQWALPNVSVNVIAVALVLLFMLVNLAGIKWVTRISIPIAAVSAGLAFVSMIAPVVAGTADWSALGRLHLTTPFPGWFGQVTSLMAGLYLIGFAAPAFEAATCHVGETIDQNRNVPRAMYAAIGMAAVFFVGLPVVWFCVLGPDPLAGDLGQVLGPTFAPLMGAFGKSGAIGFMMFNMFHGTMQPLAGAARTLSQLSEDGLLPRFLALRDSRDAPWVATVLTAAFSILFLLIGDPIWLVAAANFTYLIGICLPSIAVWLLRRDAPEAERPWRAPRYTIGLGVTAALVWLASTMLGFEQFGLPTAVFGLAMAYSGAALYAWRKIEDRVAAGLPPIAPTLHVSLTGSMLLVLSLDAVGYVIAVGRIPTSNPDLIAALEDIFVVVAILTITVGIVLPGMVANTAAEISAAALKLSSGVLRDFSNAMASLARGNLAGAHLQADIVPVAARGRDELGVMAESFNTLQREVKNAAVGIDGAREGLRAARSELTEANDHLRDEVRKQEELTAQLILSRDAAEAGNRSKSEFLAIISHELRTPLHGVIGMTDLLLGSGLDDLSRRRAETLHEAGGHLLQLINDLLDFSKLEANQLAFEETIFEPDNVMRMTLDMFGAPARAKGIHLAKHIANDVPLKLMGDAGRLRQVLINLIGNALKFTEKGTVCVEMGLLHSEGQEAILQFSVRDTGIGIEPDKKHSLFREFSQLDTSISRRFGGAGLGLAISKRLVERMDGRIEAESEPGKGSTFRFTCRFRLPQTRSEQTNEASPRLDGRRFLFIDGDNDERNEWAREAAASGAEVEEFSEAGDVLDRLRAAHAEGKPYDALLIGYSQAVALQDQLSLAVRTDTRLSNTRLILATPGGLDEARRRLAAAAFNVILETPIIPERLIQTLNIRPSASSEAALRAIEPRAEPADDRVRVLVAEDNETNRIVLKGYLDKAGVAADFAVDGVEAVAAMRARPYNLVLMDVMMPELDGVSATRQIRQLPGAAAAVPIIGLTANISVEDHATFRAAGMDRVITKPLRYKQLQDLLGERALLPAS